jgi:hypothetical protein
LVTKSFDEGRDIIFAELNGQMAKDPGWDGKVTAAILAVCGNGDAALGRKRLVHLAAAERIAKGHKPWA